MPPPELRPELRPTPPCPLVETRVYSSLRLRPSPHRLSAPMCGPRLEHTHLSPEVLAQGGLCCPTPHRLATSSASLRNSASLPGFAGYRRGLWHSRAIGPACPPRPSGLSPLYFPGLPPSAFAGSPGTCTPVLPYRHWPSDKGEKSLATPNTRSNQLHAELAFDDWFVRFRYGPPVCLPRWADQT